MKSVKSRFDRKFDEFISNDNVSLPQQEIVDKIQVDPDLYKIAAEYLKNETA
jgi:hypothetical protein